MIIDCVFKQGDMCLAVNERIENVKKTRGWGCDSEVRCLWRTPGATGVDRDIFLLEIYRELKRKTPDDVLLESQLAGHGAEDDNDYYSIEYDAGMLVLFMNKKWKYLLDDDFCCAAKLAKRLGLRIPTNTNKAFKRRIKKCCLGITRMV